MDRAGTDRRRDCLSIHFGHWFINTFNPFNYRPDFGGMAIAIDGEIFDDACLTRSTRISQSAAADAGSTSRI